MNRRFTTVAAVTAAISISLAGQAPSSTGKAPAKSAASKYTPPKTAWGDPDIQGNWPAAENIPMNRDPRLGERLYLTDAELEKRKEVAAKDQIEREEFRKKTTSIGPPSNWNETGIESKQTSMVVDPPNGRTPPLTPEAAKIVKDQRNGAGPAQHFPEKVDTWEDFDMYSRCITRGFPSTMLPTLYNYGNDIVQSPGYVAIRSEMVHETRVIPLDGRPHVGKEIATYMGDARGHWEGNTLVVETTNLKEESGFGGGRYTKDTRIIEKFTRKSPTEMDYDITISDPEVWTKPWSIHYPFKMDPEYKVYEYACHEGNYMMLDALSGARKLESQGRDTRVDRGEAGGPLPRTLRPPE